MKDSSKEEIKKPPKYYLHGHADSCLRYEVVTVMAANSYIAAEQLQAHTQSEKIITTLKHSAKTGLRAGGKKDLRKHFQPLQLPPPKKREKKRRS